MTPREFYLNADFDWTLLGAPSLLEGDDPTFLHEMPNHFLFAAGTDDSVILHAPLPTGFRDYLSSKGFDLPRTPVHPAFTAEADFTPFGWNTLAVGLNGRYARPTVHPALEVVCEANGRAFSHAWEAGEGRPFGALVESLVALESHRTAHPEQSGWVAKGNHGHAGTANRRLPPGPLDAVTLDALNLLFRENGLVALEPWQERIRDMAMNFTVARDGVVGDLRGHETVVSRDGAFLGVKVSPGGRAPEPWRDRLESAAGKVGKALHALGYFGPVGVDAYAWRDAEGAIRLRPCVDINARLSMARPAHGLAGRLPDRHIFWTWAKPKKLTLPSDYPALKSALGPADYSPRDRVGILAASPLRLEPDSPSASTKPKRISFALIARDEEKLAGLRTAFQSSLGRP